MITLIDNEVGLNSKNNKGCYITMADIPTIRVLSKRKESQLLNYSQNLLNSKYSALKESNLLSMYYYKNNVC